MRVSLSVFASLLLWAGSAAATSFPRPPELATAVAFWRAIFTEYSEHEIVIHHRDDVGVIYSVLDFSDVAPLLDEDELRLHMRQREQAEKERLQELLLTLADKPVAPDLPAEARQLRDKLAHRDEPQPYRRAAERLRGQRGLKEKFQRAIMRSGRYLPYMEEVFAEAGLPVLLTRLPLVESSFNEHAYSRSGAAGIWQFMPGSARRYMQFDEVGDDRRDPWASTRGAAAHLADDFSLLQDWPLAVTAYNFGRYGIARALEATGGARLVDLIERYDGPRWGFAAKHFYAEFLAAVEVEQNAMQYFGPLRRDAPTEFEEVETQHYVRYETLQRLAAEDLHGFARLNPKFSNAVVDGQLYVPPGQRIRVPTGMRQRFEQAYARLDDSELYSAQRSYHRRYRVRSGDTLSGLARRFGTSVRSIQKANGLDGRGFIRIGQTLKIPPGGRTSPPPAHHTVRPGDTLAGISRRYNVTLDYLKETNDLKRPELLRVGQRITLPAGAVKASHEVRPGQTVAGIARQYGVSIADIARVNELSDVHRIRVGQRLEVPLSP